MQTWISNIKQRSQLISVLVFSGVSRVVELNVCFKYIFDFKKKVLWEINLISGRKCNQQCSLNLNPCVEHVDP